MKIQLDTTARTIKVESDVKFSELIEALEKLLPKGEWKKFTLETNVVINNWTSPIVIKEYPYYPSCPWIVYCGDTLNTNYSLNSGIYNVEC